MNPDMLRRIPLVARPRPACTPLHQRIADLNHRATLAARTGDVTAAVAVFNLAALLASDCGCADLARQWCHQLANTVFRHRRDPRHGLEPIVNLARLHIRAGDGTTAWHLLESLYQAVDNRTDTVIGGLTIPVEQITSTAAVHGRLRSWLWTVLLSTGAQALAAAGRWDDARHRLERHKGIGRRMLDGRQIAIIAHIVAGDRDAALTMLRTTPPGEPWEDAVTACFRLACGDSSASIEATATFLALDQAEPHFAVFRTRLGLTVIDALSAPTHPASHAIAACLTRYAAEDGYAARELLTHPLIHNALTDYQARQLAALVEDCGLDHRANPQDLLSQLGATLDIADAVVTRRSH
ncbi:hypothetical protein OHA21_00795 [Actinoplanes sp. NBC_00393]|uniref:hypothetical protein n=1 Tax=Actinoplanes sp. NBC_00393 TaxID=2975953 RepID=UPI002E1DC3F3